MNQIRHLATAINKLKRHLMIASFWGACPRVIDRKKVSYDHDK